MGSGVISPLIWLITIVSLLITPLITTHEPPSIGVATIGITVNPNPWSRPLIEA